MITHKTHNLLQEAGGKACNAQGLDSFAQSRDLRLRLVKQRAFECVLVAGQEHTVALDNINDITNHAYLAARPNERGI